MSYFDSYLTLTFIIKIIFIILAIYGLYIKTFSPNTKLLGIIKFWKGKIEFIFIFLMAILFMYLFNPRYDHLYLIDSELKILLFLFGFTLLLTENWYDFINSSIISN